MTHRRSVATGRWHAAPPCRPLSSARYVLFSIGILSGEAFIVPDSLGDALRLGTTVSAQTSAALRVAPVADVGRDAEQQKAAASFTPVDPANLAATYLQHPAIATRLIPHLRYLTHESTLPARHRAILALRTAWLARSQYLWAHRAAVARLEGLSEAELRRIAQGADAAGWEPFEAALLRAADELHVDSFISDASWKALSVRYDTRQMIDTIDTVGGYTINAGMANSLGVQLEPAFPDRLPSDVPYAVAAKRTSARLEGQTPRIPPAPAVNGRGGANVFRTFSHHPPADRVRGGINTHVNSTANTLLPRHRELLLMRIGVLCNSEYEFAAHARVGTKIGMTPTDIARAVTGPSSPGDPVETLLLRATDELWEDDVISDKTWTALSATLSQKQMMDVIVTADGYRSTSMLISSAGVQLDADMKGFRFGDVSR